MDITYIAILDVKYFVLAEGIANNESGNSAKRERFMSKGSRSRWDSSDTKLKRISGMEYQRLHGKTCSSYRTCRYKMERSGY